MNRHIIGLNEVNVRKNLISQNMVHALIVKSLKKHPIQKIQLIAEVLQ